MKTEETTLKRAISALQESADLFIDQRKIASAQPRADYTLTYKTYTNDEYEILIEVKNELNHATLGQIIRQKMSNEAPLTLVTEHVSSEFARKLKEHEIQFFDAAGNAYLKDKNVYLLITGNRRKKTRAQKLGVFRPTGIKLILAFLSQPGLERADYRTIEEETGVPRSSVGRAIQDLESEGYIVTRNDGRILSRKKDLIERWVQYFSEKFRPKLNPVRFHSAKFDGRWWEKIKPEEYGAYWGGETGGEKLTRNLRPQSATLYADSKLPLLQAKFGLIRDPHGEIEILDKFWKFANGGDVAPPLVVYADLIATADERKIETAKLVYDKYLDKTAETDS